MKVLYSIIAFLFFYQSINAQQLPMKIWFNKPAQFFEEAFPIGNGKLGAMVYGKVENETISINDITFWTGKPVDNSVDSTAYKWLTPIREALFKEDYKTADALQYNLQGSNSQRFMPLATLKITNNNKEKVGSYYRELNLDSSIVNIRYKQGTTTFYKQIFASNPHKVIAMRIRANKKGALNQTFRLVSQMPTTTQSGLIEIIKGKDKHFKNTIALTGHALGNAQNTIMFSCLMHIENKGGEVFANDSVITLKNADEAIVYIVNETSFAGYDKHPFDEGLADSKLAVDYLDNVLKTSYNNILKSHIKDYRSYFKRLELSLDGAVFDSKRTTEEQLKDYTSKNEKNKYLETLYFQFGRYLVISSSRTSGVPTNLQGLWNEEVNAPWRCNYTMNINLEENYWPVEVSNLSEMFLPLNSFLKGLAHNGKYTAKNYYGISEGWCAGHTSDIWAMSNPMGEKTNNPEWANWNMAGAWLMSLLWEHYMFNKDLNYLRKEAYPLMKGACEFMLKWLIPNPLNKNELITAPCTSPENEYVNDKGYHGTTFYGSTADLAILRELFGNTIKATKLLNEDTLFSSKLQEALNKFHPYTIGQYGDINEWYYDWNDYDPHHRHQSHLIGLFPGHHISINETPNLATAAKKTLIQKGDRTTGWSTGWRINLWARLKEPQKAYNIYRKLLNYVSPDKYVGADQLKGGGTYPNLFDAHPPFQIDGNFSGTAGVCEMLMQSDEREISLLPACPSEWSSGSVKGLKARGAFVVDFSWKNKKINYICIKSLKGGDVKLSFNNQSKNIVLKPNQKQILKIK